MGLGKSLSMISLMVNNTQDLLLQASFGGTSGVGATLLIVPPSREYFLHYIDSTLTSTSSSDMGGAVPKVNVSQLVYQFTDHLGTWYPRKRLRFGGIMPRSEY
jgi:hypothetical protein